ncbi:MAG: response regulator [Candidatus Omnitrophica bacterium]|nr:response regulator [Candidatus Omnitrophota bacterium]
MIKKILLVEDDLDFIEACRNLLEAAGFTVEEEPLADKVMAKVKEFAPDLIILDVLLQKERKGFDIAEALAGDELLCRIPVIFLTGYFKRMVGGADRDDLRRRLKNVKDVLDKPVKPSVLLDTIRSVG